MYIEVMVIGVLLYIVLDYTGSISTNKFIIDNEKKIKKLKEKDFDFYAKTKYGDSVDIEKLFNLRLRNGLIVIFLCIFVFIAEINYIEVLFSIVAGYLVYKLSYFQLKRYYKSHLSEIDSILPY